MYNLSGIQKGIQSGHAALEYADLFKDDPIYKEFIEKHKTFILLDGGGSGDMLNRHDELIDLGIPFAVFEEPDLNNAMSAIAFILKESQYDFKIPNWMECGDLVDLDGNPDYEIYNYIRKFRLALN